MYYVLSKDIIESEIICHLPLRKRGFPIVGISWNDAVVYCKLLSSKTAKSYCLSTGAEQKYAACGRQSSNDNVYSDCTNIENVGCNNSYSDLHNMWSEANKPPKNFHQLDNGRSYTNIS